MTIILDDVLCLLEQLSYERGIQLLEDVLGFTEDDAVKEVKTHWGPYVSHTHLKRCYERLLSRCSQLERPADEEEQNVVRTA